ncbi:hypothetical protein [Paenibacillus dauci]|uniref:hypothetical protein n=1 Tax=Paenibacillus dauci TaxID=1567106 RepID=UPI000AF05CDF|nr:hypothetical protein [Paenibacillus dauci]
MSIFKKKRQWLGLVVGISVTAVSIGAVPLMFPNPVFAYSEKAGMLETYYNPTYTLAQNVQETLDISSSSASAVRVRVTDVPFYIDVNGLRIDLYNRTTPYYQIGRQWEPQNESLVQKELMIEGKKVIVGFTDDTRAYLNDPVIEKMVRKQISYELSSQPQWNNQDHQAFINELLKQGMIVIQSVKQPQEFEYNTWSPNKGEVLGEKPITTYDNEPKIQNVIDQKVYLNKAVKEGQGKQIGTSFRMDSGQTLAIQINRTADTMPTLHCRIKDLTTGQWVGEFMNAQSGYRYMYIPNAYSSNHLFKVIMSGESQGWADVEIFTYSS